MGVVPTIIAPLRKPAAGLLLALAWMGSAAAQELVLPEHDCAITPPAGWSQQNHGDQPGTVALFWKPDHMASIFLMVRPSPEGTEVNDAFIQDFERGLGQHGGGNRMAGRLTELAGLKAYERLGIFAQDKTIVTTVIDVLPARGRVYVLHATSFDGDVAGDKDVRAAFDSFRLLTKVTPTPSPQPTMTPVAETSPTPIEVAKEAASATPAAKAVAKTTSDKTWAIVVAGILVLAAMFVAWRGWRKLG